MDSLFNWYFASNDEQFFFAEQLKQLTFFPDLWKGQEGFGVSALQYLWIDYPFRLITFLLTHLGLSWFFINKFWWGLVFFLAIFGSVKFASLFPISRRLQWLTAVIYSTNTYILMLFDGGQLGVALAYAFSPYLFFVVYRYFTKLEQNRKQTVWVAFIVSVIVFLDLRIAYLMFLLLGLTGIFLLVKKRLKLSKQLLLMPIIILCMNFFWLLPTVMYRNSLNTFINQTTSVQSDLSFFSVASFSDAISLLHPNYPDNIFGYLYFFKPEFLVVPIVAFLILFSTKITSLTFFFLFVLIFSAFLAKGVQDPFGSFYYLLYSHVPGFFLFRDPTKWYLIVALSFSVIIPQSIEYLQSKIKSRYFFILLFIFFWLFSLRYVINGRVNGNMTPQQLTNDYIQLKEILKSETSQGRTVWLPKKERFEYNSDIHPSISGSDLFIETSASGILRILKTSLGIETIINAGGLYVVVPIDGDKRIFLDNYKYDQTIRTNLISVLDNSDELQRISGFEQLAVYRINKSKPFFSYQNNIIQAVPLHYDRWELALPKRINEGILETQISYDPNWRLTIDTSEIFSQRSISGSTMNFIVPSGEQQIAYLEYLPTEQAKIGAVVSLLTLILCLFIICI